MIKSIFINSVKYFIPIKFSFDSYAKQKKNPAFFVGLFKGNIWILFNLDLFLIFVLKEALKTTYRN